MLLTKENYSDFLMAELATTSKPEGLVLEKLSGNRLRIEFVSNGQLMRFRVLFFGIGSTSRGKPEERRVEITATYKGNLEKLPGHADIVIGVERSKRLIVGLDARRLNEGGATHNASTFIYLPSFDKIEKSEFFIYQNDRQKLFDSEYQIYLKPSFLIKYLSQQAQMHATGVPALSAADTKDKMTDSLELFASNGSSQKLTFSQQLQLAAKKMFIGQLGERFVFEAEMKRLESAGKDELAKKVKWVSQTQPYLGYDIFSFSKKAEAEVLEVKSSVSAVKSFYFTQNEMKIAKERKSSYRLVCVSHVMQRPVFLEYRDPIAAIKEGKLTISPETYLVTVN